jgi:hypothetical protein
MGLPHWVGIPGVIVLLGMIGFGFWRGMRVREPGDGGGSGDHGFSPPSDHHS